MKALLLEALAGSWGISLGVTLLMLRTPGKRGYAALVTALLTGAWLVVYTWG